MTDLLAISVLLAVCGGLLLLDHFGNAHRQVVALRLRAIHHRSSGDSLISAAALTAPFLLRLGNLESRFEILGWQYIIICSDKNMGIGIICPIYYCSQYGRFMTSAVVVL